MHAARTVTYSARGGGREGKMELTFLLFAFFFFSPPLSPGSVEGIINSLPYLLSMPQFYSEKVAETDIATPLYRKDITLEIEGLVVRFLRTWVFGGIPTYIVLNGSLLQDISRY